MVHYLLIVISIYFLAYKGSLEMADIDSSKKKNELLTNGSSKKWKYKLKNKSSDCFNRDIFHDDNTYIFSIDSKMEFDNGTITEEGNCGDFTDLEGIWEFSKKEDSLKVIAIRRKDNSKMLDTTPIINGKILSISADKIELDYIELTPSN